MRAVVPASHLALCFLSLLIPAAGRAQQIAHPQTIPDQVPRNSAGFPKPSQKSQRFLGWHYAATAHQDTTRWKRDVGKPVLAKNSKAGSNSSGLGLAINAITGSASQPLSIGGFAAATALPTGFIPTAIVQGDFNGDGKLDLAISNGGDNTIYVLLGNGDGTFAVPEILYTQGRAPVWLAAAQLRTNGHLDLIAVDADSNQLEIFTGNGDGTFQAGEIVANLTQTPSFILAGDFNNDGNMDLAVGLVVDTGADEPQFEIFLGDGSGSFPTTISPPPVTNGTGGPLETDWLAAGDLNNDGWLDLVTTVEFGGSIAYLNRNAKAFLQGPIFGPEDNAVVTALGDMNGDGCLDAVEAGGYGELTIATGSCDGTFTQTTPIAELGDIDVGMVIADIDGDGNPDVVASSAFSEAEAEGGIGAYGGYLVSVLKGDGKGSVSPAAIYRVGAQAYSLAVADLRGTQRPDIITVSQNENKASELFNDLSGGFGRPSGEAIGYVPTASHGVVTNAPNPLSVPQTVDLNGDGKPDVIDVEYGYLGTQPFQITALLNDGTGKLGPPIRSPITVGPNIGDPIFLVGNFRNAKTPDIIYAITQDENPIAFFPGNGDGTFGAPVVLTSQVDPILLASGDFNGDGKLDFVVLDEVLGITPQLDVFLGNGDGTFNHLAPQVLSSFGDTQFFQLIVGDFNHDGELDLLIGYETDRGPYNLDLALGNGNGTFQAPTLAMPNFGFVTVADVNRDGYPDLIQEFDPDSTIGQSAIDGFDGIDVAAITIYLGGPGGQFQQSGSYFSPGTLAGQPLVGDFNGDGVVDIALPYRTAETAPLTEARLQVFQGVGDGTFLTVGGFYQLPDFDYPVAGGDYRGLGVTDLLDLVGSTSSINTISASSSPALTITPDISPLTGNTGSATVTLAAPAISSQVVQLTSSDPAVSFPSNITFAPGQAQQSFSFTIGSGFDNTHVLALYAQFNGQTAVAYIPKANPNAISGVSAQIGRTSASVSLAPGETISFMFFLQSLGGYSGVFNGFTCSGLPAGASCEFATPSVSLAAGGLAENGVTLVAPNGTALGSYSMTISASNGALAPSATSPISVGDYSFSINPAIVSVDSISAPDTTVSATFLDGFNQNITVSCPGLPTGASCSPPITLYPGLPTYPIVLLVSPQANLPPADYPFQVIGSIDPIQPGGFVNGVSRAVNAILRVSSFTASLDKTSAVTSNGGSATFNITFTSENHFSSSEIAVSCNNVAGLTCSGFPSQVSLADGGTASMQLFVKYTAPVTAASRIGHFVSNLARVLVCFIVLIFPWGIRRRRWISYVVVCALLPTICGCGGSSGGGGGSSQTLQISVVAEAPISSGTLQENVGTISLTVQQ